MGQTVSDRQEILKDLQYIWGMRYPTEQRRTERTEQENENDCRLLKASVQFFSFGSGTSLRSPCCKTLGLTDAHILFCKTKMITALQNPGFHYRDAVFLPSGFLKIGPQKIFRAPIKMFVPGYWESVKSEKNKPICQLVRMCVWLDLHVSINPHVFFFPMEVCTCQ